MLVVIDAFGVEGLHALETGIHHSYDLDQQVAHGQLEGHQDYTDGDADEHKSSGWYVGFLA